MLRESHQRPSMKAGMWDRFLQRFCFIALATATRSMRSLKCSFVGAFASATAHQLCLISGFSSAFLISVYLWEPPRQRILFSVVTSASRCQRRRASSIAPASMLQGPSISAKASAPLRLCSRFSAGISVFFSQLILSRDIASAFLRQRRCPSVFAVVSSRQRLCVSISGRLSFHQRVFISALALATARQFHQAISITSTPPNQHLSFSFLASGSSHQRFCVSSVVSAPSRQLRHVSVFLSAFMR